MAKSVIELTDRQEHLARTVGHLGFLRPRVTVWAAHRADLKIINALAALTMESGDGKNVFGHDPTIFAGAGHVTKAKYLEYKRQRGHTRMQGVGPMQLTWWELQDMADAKGGCWVPRWNMLVGFTILEEHMEREHSIHDGARRYNGSGPAAEAYADKFMVHRARFRRALRREGFRV